MQYLAIFQHFYRNIVRYDTHLLQYKSIFTDGTKNMFSYDMMDVIKGNLSIYKYLVG